MEFDEIRRDYVFQATNMNGSLAIPNPVTTFEEASRPVWLQYGVKAHFYDPTPIQIQGWPIASHGRDLVGIAETGSGKTLAYLAAMMVHVKAQAEFKAVEGPVGIVLALTRELAIQINSIAEELAGASGLHSTCVYGGVPVREQMSAVQEKVDDVIVGTPRRLIQLLNEQYANLNRVTYVVVDEADEMLSKSFWRPDEPDLFAGPP